MGLGVVAVYFLVGFGLVPPKNHPQQLEHLTVWGFVWGFFELERRRRPLVFCWMFWGVYKLGWG